MKHQRKLIAGTAAALVAGAALIAAPAHATTSSYERTSAMSHVVSSELATSATTDQKDPKAVVGVAKALAAGFKAAQAPQAAGNVARLASILGSVSEAPAQSPAVEAAYFDR
jgi:hypothetical protein